MEHDTNHATTLCSGTLIKDRYKVIKLLGRGGMSNVYLVEDLKLRGQHWALKEIGESELTPQLIREVQLLCELNHPQLPRIIDYYEPDDQGYAYLVLEYIAGQTLNQWWEQEKDKRAERFLKAMKSLAEVLSFLHEQDPPIIYRDIKPENIMVNPDGQIKLIDFGIARKYVKGQQKDTVSLGTLGFAAPEQYMQDQQTDTRTDVYAYGATFYYVLTKRYVQEGMPPIGQFMQLLEEHGVSDIALQRSSWHQIYEVLQRLTHYDLSQRPLDLKTSIQNLFTSIEPLEHGGNKPLGERFVKDPTTQKIILIGSLWPRAGATTVALNLCRLLAKQHQKVSFIEFHQSKPYVFDFLSLYKDVVQRDDQSPLAWQKDLLEGMYVKHQAYQIDWVINPPYESFSSPPTFEQFLSIVFQERRSTVTIVDIGTAWTHPHVLAFMKHADMLLITLESHPIYLDRIAPIHDDDLRFKQTQENKAIQSILQNPNTRPHSVYGILQKYSPHHSIKLDHFNIPFSVPYRFPYISHDDYMHALYHQHFLADNKTHSLEIEKQLKPLLKSIFPNYQFASKKRKLLTIPSWSYKGGNI